MALLGPSMSSSSSFVAALDYSLKRWVALTRFVGDGQLPVDNNHIENQMRPIAIGRINGLFAVSWDSQMPMKMHAQWI